MAVHGHTLLFAKDSVFVNPDWLLNGNWTRDDLIAILQDHITTVVGRYQGRISSWDVVNEAVTESGALRDCLWLRGIGPEYIAMAFQWAHDADPQAVLYYRDYSIAGAKGVGIYVLVSNLLQGGVPIHAVGFQSHLFPTYYNLSVELLESEAYYMLLMSQLGIQTDMVEVEAAITEPVTDLELWLQGFLFYQMMEKCISLPSCKVFELWGFTDRYSWIDYFLPTLGAPLIFDEDYNPKLGYYFLRAALRDLCSPAPTGTDGW
jgi:endo-1,4-beta-xylanase